MLKGGSVLTPVQTGVNGLTACPLNANGISQCAGTGNIDFVDGRGGSLQRGYSRGPGFGLYSTQNRDRYELNAHLQNIFGSTPSSGALSTSGTNTTSTRSPADRLSPTRLHLGPRQSSRLRTPPNGASNVNQRLAHRQQLVGLHGPRQGLTAQAPRVSFRARPFQRLHWRP